MKFIFFILILLLVLTFLYFNKQITLLKNKTLILINQNNNLKNKIYTQSKKNIFIQFYKPKYKIGILSAKSTLKISPFEFSNTVFSLLYDTEVLIWDMALVDNFYWYYISIPSKNNINSHGWVQENAFINLFCDFEKNIIKK